MKLLFTFQLPPFLPSYCLHTFASLNICKSMFRNVLADIFFVDWTVQRCHCLAQLALWTWSRLKIFCWCWWSLSLGWISGLSSDCCPDNFRKHTQGTYTCIRCTSALAPTARPASHMTHFDYSVFKQQVTGFPVCHLCRWPLFRGSIQDPGRAGWQHARSTSELSYHWHQVSPTCHVFILWEFNPPFGMDQALCRWREAVQIFPPGNV